MEYTTVQAYVQAIHKAPGLHQEFLTCRMKVVRLKLENPSLHIRGGNDEITPARLMTIKQNQDSTVENKIVFNS